MAPGASKKAHPVPKAGTGLWRTPESILAFRAPGSGIPHDTNAGSVVAHTGDRGAEPKQAFVSKGGKATKGRPGPKQASVKRSDEAIKDRAVQQERVISASPATGVKQELVEEAGEAIKDRPAQQKRVDTKSPDAIAPASRRGNGPARVPYTGPLVASANASNQSSGLQAVPPRKAKKKVIRYTGTDALLGRRFRYVPDGPKVTAADIVEPTFFEDAFRAISEANNNDHEQQDQDDASGETLAGLAESAMQNTLLYADLDDPNAFAHPVPQPLVTLTTPLGDFSVLDDGLYAFGGGAAAAAASYAGNGLCPFSKFGDVDFCDPYEKFIATYRSPQGMTEPYALPWMKAS